MDGDTIVEDLAEDDENSIIMKEKADFMYAFEGAMSVIRETEEPDEDFTTKNSRQSSIWRLESMKATPDML